MNTCSSSDIHVNRMASLIYNFFINTAGLSEKKITSKIWQKMWQWSCNYFSVPVNTKVHGYNVIVNYGYLYPIFSRKFGSYNNPLVELVNQTYLAKNAPVNFVDIGAAIGDTVLLIYSNCPGMIKSFCCVDGDQEFFAYLQSNLGNFDEGKLIFSVLSSCATNERELIRTHLGTASAQGSNQVIAKPLDSVIAEAKIKDIDVLKIDVDGFDGKVLKGSRNLLQSNQPSVIFEWHPILYDETKNSWMEPFDILNECGYDRFFWFDKYGNFSHFMSELDKKSIVNLGELCLRNNHSFDWHYDIVALHHTSRINSIEFAEQSFAKGRASKF